MKKLIVLTGLIVSSVLTALATNAHATNFTGLGDLPGSGFSSSAYGISSDGSTVVGQSSSASGSQAFRWTSGGGMVGLGDLAGGSFSSCAYDVSANGSVIVGYGKPALGYEAFRWTSGSGMVGLGIPSGYPYNFAKAVSADGSTIVGYRDSGSENIEAVLWRTNASGSVMTTVVLGTLPGYPLVSRANAVSADGSIVVGRCDLELLHHQAFYWTWGSGMVGLGFLDGGIIGLSSASGISADGSTIVGYSYSSVAWAEAMRWTSGSGMVGLGGPALGFDDSSATDVSADGSVIVGHGDGEAFIWDETNGISKLKDFLVGYGVDLTGWTLKKATGISDDGMTVVGSGINPDGNNEAWIAAIPPPGSDIFLSAPKGGESLLAGTTCPISWLSIVSITNVMLEYSDANGADGTWEIIDANTPNDGEYSWMVPEVTSEQCLVRISDITDPTNVNDVSDGTFTIYQCQLDSIADLNNDCEVNMPDFIITSAGWLDEYGFDDLVVLANDWLSNGNPFD